MFVCFKWSSKRNSLTTHLGMVICTHYLTRVYSKLAQGHFLQTFTSFRKCHFKDHVWLDKSFLDGTVFALAFFELWERTNWHPVSNSKRLYASHENRMNTTLTSSKEKDTNVIMLSLWSLWSLYEKKIISTKGKYLHWPRSLSFYSGPEMLKSRGGFSTLSWVRMCGPKFRPPPYKKTREDANLLPISKPFVSWRVLFKTNQCFLQYKLGCISTFWQPIDKPKHKFIRNYAFCKNATYIKPIFK